MGVSHFLEHMMFKGSTTRPASEVNEAFDRIGARNNAFTSHELTAYHAHALPEHFATSFSLVADLLRPAIREEDFTSERRVILEEIAMYEDNPFWVVYEQAIEKYFQGHPLGYRVLGTKETVGSLTREQMQEYFSKHYSPSNTVVAAAGRVDFDELVRQAEKETRQWPAVKIQRQFQTCVPHAASFTIEDKKATRGYMVLMWPGPAESDPRRYAGMLVADIAGGSDGSRLHWSLVETGIAVHAAVAQQTNDGVGTIVSTAVCPAEDLDRVLAIIKDEFKKLSASFTEDDLLRSRKKIATAVAVAGESPNGRMQRIGHQLVTTKTFRSLEAELETLNALTIDDLRSFLVDFPFDPVVVGRLIPPPIVQPPTT